VVRVLFCDYSIACQVRSFKRDQHFLFCDIRTCQGVLEDVEVAVSDDGLQILSETYSVNDNRCREKV